MLQIGFREVGVRIGEIGDLAKIAYAIKEGGGRQIMVYFEFDDAEQLLFFCSAVQTMSALKGVSELESRKKELQNQILEQRAEVADESPPRLPRTALPVLNCLVDGSASVA